MAFDEYVTPASVEESVAMLASLRGAGRVIAGGTDLVIQLQHKERKASCLVDVTGIPGLAEIRREDSFIIVGAATTFAQLEQSPIVRRGAPVLAEAASWVGSPQIRNVGTLGGNVVNAQPAADGSIALLALDAEAEIANLTGRQWVPLDSLFVSPGVSRIDATAEMITAFRFRPQAAWEGSAFERLARRRALSLPLINVGVRVQLSAERTHVRRVRISIGPVAPVPFRAGAAEKLLQSRPLDEATIREASEVAAREGNPRSSLLRASKEYRIELVRTLTERALSRAIQAARG
ncbi:MAG TPA: FAD binding domain-containing protein [Anaerolineae bacterium]|nr:FAD binding domain-containing protein [Anaerolineae bacterium]HNT06098.1 FAD binding domain-containing protein [Anaerolineae bacterium]